MTANPAMLAQGGLACLVDEALTRVIRLFLASKRSMMRR
jgi:hypothetical protein